MTSDPTRAGPAPPAAPPSRGHAVLVAAGIFLSRIAGLVRQGVLSYFLGTSGAMSAFTAAMRIPNFLQNLLGEGVLSASLIPVYSKLLAQKDEQTAGRVAGTVASFLALITAAIVTLGVLFAPLLVDLLAPGYEGEIRELTILLVRILFPGIGLLVLSAWCLAVLNSHRQFFIPYAAPVLWNAAIIAALLTFAPGEGGGRVAVIAGWGVVAGAVLQLGIQVPFVLRRAVPIRLGIARRLEPVRQVVRNFVPVVFGRGVVQVSAFVDEIFASYLGPAALGAIGYAYTIYLLPFSLFGMSVSAAELPEMSSAVGTEEEVRRRLRERLGAGLRQISFFVVPSVVAFLAIGDVLVAALYQRGRFGAESTRYVWYIVIGYAVGLLAGTLSRLYSSAFYALNDTRTPLKFAVVRVALAAGLGWALAFPLRPALVRLISDGLGAPIPDVAAATLGLGAVGLSFASGAVSWVELGLLRGAMRRRIGPLPASGSFQLRLWGAAIAAGGAGLALGRIALPAYAAALHPISAAIVVAGAFGVVYLALCAALRVPEVRAITRRLGIRR
ncbi:MAG TPA: murein biosynthesis integral membrane protein MurJ [Thermoanaerobaculia bacterium]|nr:murein biosynthesis integral membrane protein MurJ [Thermoanaerobaculia bacterium]